jgi:hypothetical protein
MRRALSPRSLRRILNLWPPYLFAGVRVRAIARFDDAGVRGRCRDDAGETFESVPGRGSP